MNDFFADLFELWGTNESPISDELYDFNIFGTVGMVWGLLILLAFGIYYYGWNSPKYNKFIHWLMVGVGTGILISIFAFFYSNSTFKYEGIESESLSQGFVHLILTLFVYTLFSFFVVSMAGKWWSVNCSKTPF